MKLHEVLTDYISREVPPKLLGRGDLLFGRTTPEHNASMRCVTEFRNAGRFRDQEFHIAVIDRVSDLIGPVHGMDRDQIALAHGTPKRIATT